MLSDKSTPGCAHWGFGVKEMSAAPERDKVTVSDLSDLIAGANENLGVEFKAWMDTTDPEHRAKLARHIAALANHGGGYLVFGIDDKTRKPLGATDLPPSSFGQDAISAIVKRYLEPRLQVLLQGAEFEGVTYPVVVVPSHGARPVVAIADGPQGANGRPVGISQGTVYVRAAGPESVPIRSSDDWNTLLERCLSHRADLLGSILRQSIGGRSQPDSRVLELLVAAVTETAADFTAQTRSLTERTDAKYHAQILQAGENYSAMGYALVDADGDPISIESPRTLNDRVSVAMHQYAYYGWGSFLPLSVPERAPQVRMSTLGGRETTYLEGMRVENTGLISSAFDYWRIYECGIAVSVESLRDNWSREGQPSPPKHLTPLWILVAIHSLLAHARLMGQELPGVAQVIVRMDWRGLSDRMLMWDNFRVVASTPYRDDRFARTIPLQWAELRDDYFGALRRVALPFMNLFATQGWFQPESWLTPDAVQNEFKRLEMRSMRLFDD